MHLKARTSALAALSALVMALAVPQFAQAGTSTYPGSAEMRDFGTTDGGWHSSTSFGGLCVPAVNCPIVTNDHAASGGTDGQDDGYLRTTIGSLLGVGATSRATLQSPSFAYEGAGGQEPSQVTFSISRRSSLGQLLAVAGNSATYSVDLVDVTQGGNGVSVINNESIGDQNSWLAEPVSVSPQSLTVGDSYRIRVRSVFSTGTQVVPGGSVGYDDVSLQASAQPGGQHPGGNHHRRQIRHQVRHGISTAHVSRHGVTFKARCPGSARPHKCAMKLSARLSKKGPRITNTRKARLGAAKTRRIRLHLKHRYAKQARHRKHIVIKAHVKVGHQKVNVVKSVRIVRH